jgi:spiro-SPASM protein
MRYRIMIPVFPQDDVFRADTQGMKSLAVLFAGDLAGFALEPIDGVTAFARALSAASRFPDVARVLVLASPSSSTVASAAGADVVVRESWTPATLFALIAAESEGFDHVYYARASCPFLDVAFAAELYKKHIRYAAEYTFADGYPLGLAPEILARGIVPMLARLAEKEITPVTPGVVFDTVKKEINSFDIETDIAPKDLRHLRLDFSCDSKRDLALCSSFVGITAENYADLVASRPSALRTLPAFYAVQVSGKCPYECSYCPYPAFCRSGKGSSSGVPATGRDDFMTASDFSSIVDKAASLSCDAVVSLSLWGECAYHPDIASLVRTVLDKPGLSVLVETTGLGWTEGTLEAIARLSSIAGVRGNGQNPVNWIVSLDAAGSAQYGAAHGISSERADGLLREALSTTERLLSLFPGAVWPQMVRMKENEVELETFYRFWKERAGRVIVQKHDHFCGTIADRRVADLSPLVRRECWHIKRDMCILIDGTVPMCREDIYANREAGNALTGDLASIWQRSGTVHEQHVNCVYEGMCGACDEYYTFNF